MHTRTGPQAPSSILRKSSGRSRPSLRTARLITCQLVRTSRTCSTSCIHREEIHAQGQRGSNQKSAVGMSDILPRHDRLQFVSAENLTRDEAQERARLLAVDSYDFSHDPTTAEK